jgi:hypothetical protein
MNKHSFRQNHKPPKDDKHAELIGLLITAVAFIGFGVILAYRG